MQASWPWQSLLSQVLPPFLLLPIQVKQNRYHWKVIEGCVFNAFAQCADICTNGSEVCWLCTAMCLPLKEGTLCNICMCTYEVMGVSQTVSHSSTAVLDCALLSAPALSLFHPVDQHATSVSTDTPPLSECIHQADLGLGEQPHHTHTLSPHTQSHRTPIDSTSNNTESLTLPSRLYQYGHSVATPMVYVLYHWWSRKYIKLSLGPAEAIQSRRNITSPRSSHMIKT